MATDLTAIREAMAAALTTGLDGIQVSAYMLANPTPPTIHLYPSGPAGDIEYDLAMHRGLDRWPFTVQAFVGLTSDIGAQMNLDQFLAPSGAQSVKAAIELDSSLGGTVSDVSVVRCGGYRVYARDGAPPVLGAEWYVEVLATGF